MLLHRTLEEVSNAKGVGKKPAPEVVKKESVETKSTDKPKKQK